MPFDQILVAAAVGAALHLLVAIVVLLRRDLQERAARTLILYAAVSFLFALLLVFWRADQTSLLPADLLTRVPTYGTLFLGWLFLHLTRSFLRLERIGLGWWALGAAWLGAAALLDGDFVTLPETLRIGEAVSVQRQDALFTVLLLGWLSFTIGAILLTLRVFQTTQQPLHQNRIKYWPLAWGFTALGGGSILFDRIAAGLGFSVVGAFIAAYAVLTHRLPDMRQVMRRVISYLAVALISAAVYVGGFLAAQYLMYRTLPYYGTWLAGAIMALVLAVLFRPLLHLVQRSVNRLIAGADYDPRRALREYSLSISNILDLEQLAAVAVGVISEAMGIKRGALFLVGREQEEPGPQNDPFLLREVKGAGQGVPRLGHLSADSPVAQCLRREHRPLTQYDIDLLPRFRQTPAEERSWWSALNMDVYVPIYAKGRWIGLFALGPKTSGDRYFDDDLALLSTLADQTAVALENARLFDDLKVRNVEIEQLNRELAAANQSLARLDEAKSDFINVASHELRTPLTQVRGYTEILAEMSSDGSITPEMAAQMTQGISKATRRLQEIINTMFDISQIDTEMLALNPSKIGAAALIGAVGESWATALEEREQTLTVQGLAGLPPIVGDGKRLHQVFSHLVQNAIKYTPNGGRIEITGRLLGEGMLPQDQTIEIVVADTGIGIATEDLERIFEKFYRVGDVLLHSTGRTKFKGAGPGLGLTIARGIVEAHGGRIWAESLGHDEESCPGSRFHVVLPVQPHHLEAEDSTAFMAALKR
jgi:signal transduction histidine kinase